MGRHIYRRKSKSAAIYVPIAVLLVLFLVTLGTSVFLKIIKIEVNGVSMYTEEEIIVASGIVAGENMLLVDAGEVSRKIYSALPYIQEVNVRFNPPDMMQINVRETTAFAAISCLDGTVLIDSACRVLERIDDAPGGMFMVRGFVPIDVRIGSALRADPSDETRLRRLAEILPAIDKAMIQDDVAYLDVTDVGYVNLVYKDQFTIIISGSGGSLNRLSMLPDTVSSLIRDPKYDASVRYKAELTDLADSWRWSPMS